VAKTVFLVFGITEGALAAYSVGSGQWDVLL